MKKKLILVFIAMFIFMIAPNVEAKEYDIGAILDEVGWHSDFHIFEVKEKDVVILDNRFENQPTFNFEIDIAGESFYSEEYTKDNLPHEYIIKSYEELTNRDIPVGKKLYIEMRITIGCGSSDGVEITYYLVDDEKKEVVYHNTYDAENNNPTSYYIEETDFLLKDVSRDGYKFLGWYTSPTFEEDTRVTMITANDPDVLNLYAKWEKIEDITNPNTSSGTYIGIGILSIVILSTVLIIVYRIKKIGE